MTKLYVKGACVSSRNNNFGISSALSDLNCGNKTNDATQDTCLDVIKNGARPPEPNTGPFTVYYPQPGPGGSLGARTAARSVRDGFPPTAALGMCPAHCGHRGPVKLAMYLRASWVGHICNARSRFGWLELLVVFIADSHRACVRQPIGLIHFCCVRCDG